MILIDFNQQIVSSAHYLQKNNIEINVSTLQHTFFKYIISRIHGINSSPIARKHGAFSKTAHDVIICCDGRNYWRRDYFPYYKIKRAENRSKSSLDWGKIFECVDEIKENIINNTKLKLINVDKVEADDIISVLVKEFSGKENICILSTDRDFVQLQEYDNIWQFSTISNSFIKPDISGVDSLIDKLIVGDKGDGVPNVLSSDDIFVQEKGRQTPIRKNKYEELYTAIKNKVTKCATYEDLMIIEECSVNLSRNNQLMNLITGIPKEISKLIIQEYDKVKKFNDDLDVFNCLNFIRNNDFNIEKHDIIYIVGS